MDKTVEKKGKAYVNRKPEKERPESDFYPTPKSLVWKLREEFPEIESVKSILCPCCGNHAIDSELTDICYIEARDLKYGQNFLSHNFENESYDAIVDNPPFSQWTEFVQKAKTVPGVKYIAFIGKVNFLAAQSRLESGVWEHLRYMFTFSRMVDYRTPQRDDGHFNVGNLVTAWFVWDMSYEGSTWETKVVDVQKYATLGGLK